MTLGNGEGYSSHTLAGDGAPIPFSIPVFRNADGSIDIAVEVRDAVTDELVDVAVRPTDYTITLNVLPGVGGVITPVNLSLFAAGRVAWVSRATKLQQQTKFRELGKFPADAVEEALDRLTAQAQDLQAQMTRALKLRVGQLPTDSMVSAVDLVAAAIADVQAVADALGDAEIAGMLSYVANGGTASRTNRERARGVIDALDFVTDAMGGATRRAQLQENVSTGLDDGPCLLPAIAWAKIDPTKRMVYCSAHYNATTDCPGLHEVQFFGPGSIKIGTGARWYVNSNIFNTGFTPLGRNTVYVAPNGNDANSGLAPEFPVKTGQAAADRFIGQMGYGRIRYAEGVYRDTLSLYRTESSKARLFEILGPTPATPTWDNSAPPTEPVPISAITVANPTVVTAAGHGRSIGQKVMIWDATKSGAAEHESCAQIFTVTAVSGNDLTLNANGSGWSAYAGGGSLVDLNGSSPTAIFYGAKNTSTYAMVQDANDYVDYYNLGFFNWGTRAVAQNAGGILCRSWGYATLTNVHAYGCGQRICIRDKSMGSTAAGGYVYKCGYGDWGIDSRCTFGGPANPGTTAITTSTLYHKCMRAVAGWEGLSAHFDGAIVKDCDEVGFATGGGCHIVSYYMRLINTTGSPLKGWKVEHGACLVRSDGATDSITGAFQPLVFRGAGSHAPLSAEDRTDWQTVLRALPSAATPGGGEQTCLTYTLKRHQMTAAGQGLRLNYQWGCANAVASVLIRTKANGTEISQTRITLAANASAREGRGTLELIQNGFGAARAFLDYKENIGGPSTVSNYFDTFGPAFDPSAGDIVLTVTMEVGASDTGWLTLCELQASGW